MKTPFCEVYVARGFCRLKPLETRPNVCLTIITEKIFSKIKTVEVSTPRLTKHKQMRYNENCVNQLPERVSKTHISSISPSTKRKKL